MDENKISSIKVSGGNDKLIIVGSGRVAWYIYRFAALLRYDITVIDNDPATLTRERFPRAQALLLGDIIHLLRECMIDENTSIVIITHHHEYDEEALLAVIDSAARYIGIMSNRRAVTAYVSKLVSMQIAEERMARVHTPIGLDIGGQMASEIALAAVAEIQAVRYNRTGGIMTVKRKYDTEKRDDWF
jgi:Xanthine and CO dehydrogenases maturation factor, XdhC/CoxF family